MRVRARAVGVVVLVALGACGKGPASSPATSPTPSVEPGRARFVAYVDESDLWLYDVGPDRVTRLIDDGDARVENNPVFLGESEVLYSAWPTDEGPTTISAIPIGGGEAREIVRGEGSIEDFDLSPDGSTITYWTVDHDGSGVHVLMQVAVTGGEPSVLRRFGSNLGRGGSSEDEVSVAWSPDGRSILATNTIVTGPDPARMADPPRTDAIFVLDSDGRDIIDPWLGTHARWTADGEAILYRGFAGAGQTPSWYTVPLERGHGKELGIQVGANNLVVAPHGRNAAYDTSSFGDIPAGAVRSGKAPEVYWYDLSADRQTALADGALAPIWISDTEVLVTDVKRAGPRARTLNSWEWLGTASLVTLDGQRTPVAMTSTWDAVALFDR